MIWREAGLVRALSTERSRQERALRLTGGELETPATAIAATLQEGHLMPADHEQLLLDSARLLGAWDDLKQTIDPSHQIAARTSSFSLQELIRDVRSRAYPLLESAGFDVTISVPMSVRSRYIGDRYRLRAILTRLMNSIVSHSGGSRAWLTATVRSVDRSRDLLLFRVVTTV